MDLLKNKEKLKDLYETKKYSAQAIADIANVDKSTVCRILKKFGIKSRKRTSKYEKMNDKEWLVGQYYDGRSMKNIAEELGCSVGVVASSLYSLGIKTRGPLEAWTLKFPRGRSGNKHPMWNGGITIVSKRIRGLKKYHDWRKGILKRDGKKCILCGSKKRIEIDHIIQLAFFIHKYSIKNSQEANNTNELWDIKNGRVLCHKCHILQETHSRKIAN